MSPLISVVIPSFNRGAELKRALDSLVHQTLKVFEVVVCDDGSNEDLHSIVSNFSQRLDIYYLRIENSGGPARPRNIAVSKSRGEWVSFLDSDDWWDNDRIAKVVDFLRPDVSFVYHPLRVLTAQNITGRRERRAQVGESFRACPLKHMALFGNPIPNSSVVVRRSLLNQIGGICEDRNLISLEDFDTWMRLAEIGVIPIFIDQPLGFYWVGEDGISKISESHIYRQIVLFERHRKNIPLEIISHAESCHEYLIGTMMMRLSGKMKEARHHLLMADDLPEVGMRLKRIAKLAITFVG